MLFQEVQFTGWLGLAITFFIGLVLPVLFLILARVLTRQGHRDVGWIFPLAACILFLLSSSIYLTSGKMTTEVNEAGVRVSIGWIPVYNRTVPANQIESVEAVEYDPQGEYGGWGIRSRKGNDNALTSGGTKGARLKLKKGQKLLIGSERADELAAAIRKLEY